MKVAAFHNDETLFLKRHPNGGWTITACGKLGEESRPLGAYSTAGDMIDALTSALHLDAAPAHGGEDE